MLLIQELKNTVAQISRIFIFLLLGLLRNKCFRESRVCLPPSVLGFHLWDRFSEQGRTHQGVVEEKEELSKDVTYKMHHFL